MSKKIARFDIVVNQGQGIGTYQVIAAGDPIPKEYQDQVADWEARGLVGEDIALDTVTDTLKPTPLPFKEVTQEDVDAEELAAAQRAAERSAAYLRGQQAQEEAEIERIRGQAQEAGGDADEAVSRFVTERGSSAAQGSEPAGLTPEETELHQQAIQADTAGKTEQEQEERVKSQAREAGGDEGEAVARLKTERGSSAQQGSEPAGLTPEEVKAAEPLSKEAEKAAKKPTPRK